ncbi:Cut9-interacting protein scn1 [Kalmusia sp. IMI 367209]|nr:Cut9-interacting protein scn1 [Kalmusia sp. IMI 367209]
MSQPDAFPWHLGVYDAHCHPTDIMSSIPSLPTMKARCLTVMGTRAEDQALVAQTADEYGVKSTTDWTREECMMPCFGWHPWFAHTMYLDDENEHAEKILTGEDKIQHYAKVLQPQREHPNDEDRQIYQSLPDPTPFSIFLSRTRKYLEQYPLALIGEIGLDRSFRIPYPWDQDSQSQRDTSLTLGGREGRKLTPFRCAPAHQKEILKRQLQLAAEYKRAVSVHGVQAHGMLFESLKELWTGHERIVLSKREKKKRGKDDPSIEPQHPPSSATQERDGESKPYPPRICLHSYSGSPSNFTQYLNPAIPVEIFASFSTAINLGDAVGEEEPKAFGDMVRAVPDGAVLVESDLHTAGEEMDRRLEDMARRICRIKGWGLEEGVEKLGRNWRRFVFGEEG